MSKFKGTKGKWEIKKWSVVSDNKEICELKQITFGLGLGGITKRDFEAAANAKLIASAPELLEALQKVYQIENHAFGLKGFDVEKFKSEIKTVLDKATE